MTKHFLLTSTAVSMLSSSFLSAGTSLKEDLKKNADQPIQLAPKEVLKQHATETKVVAKDQDELAADVQDLIQDQTSKEVIQLLEDAELLMGEATELLESKKTDGNTIAIETEIIEKIFEAAKQKQQQSSSSEEGQKSMGSMLERMEQMMGKEPGQGEGGEEGESEGNSPGNGSGGDSDKNVKDHKVGSADNTKEERTVPKNTTAPSKTLPREEQRALDAYKKATSKK